MSINSDFRDLWSALNDAGARYLLVGGYAFAFHAHPRFTKDLDVWVEPTRENARRVHAALAAFGAPLGELTEDDLATPGIVYQMGIAPNRIDILTAIDGVDFSEAWPDRVHTEYGDQRICVISRRHLLRNKLASGRPQDRLDADALSGDE